MTTNITKSSHVADQNSQYREIWKTLPHEFGTGVFLIHMKASLHALRFGANEWECLVQGASCGPFY